MAKFTTTVDFADGDQVTPTKLDQIVSGLSADTDLAADGTIVVSSGAIRVGTLSATNYGALSVGTAALAATGVTAAKLAADAVETAKIKDAAVTAAKMAADSVAWTNTLTADRATKTDMQSQAASHFVSPDIMKHHPGVSVAGGVLTMATGGIVGSHGVSGTATGTSTLRTVTLSSTMANTNYRVQISQEDSSTTANAPVITAKSETTFTVNSGATKVAFDVFGQIA